MITSRHLVAGVRKFAIRVAITRLPSPYCQISVISDIVSGICLFFFPAETSRYSNSLMASRSTKSYLSIFHRLHWPVFATSLLSANMRPHSYQFLVIFHFDQLGAYLLTAVTADRRFYSSSLVQLVNVQRRSSIKTLPNWFISASLVDNDIVHVVVFPASFVDNDNVQLGQTHTQLTILPLVQIWPISAALSRTVLVYEDSTAPCPSRLKYLVLQRSKYKVPSRSAHCTTQRSEH